MVWWQDGLVARWFGGKMIWWQDGLVARWFGGEMTVNLETALTQSNASILEGAFPSLPARGERLLESWLYVGATSSTSSHSR